MGRKLFDDQGLGGLGEPAEGAQDAPGRRVLTFGFPIGHDDVGGAAVGARSPRALAGFPPDFRSCLVSSTARPVPAARCTGARALRAAPALFSSSPRSPANCASVSMIKTPASRATASATARSTIAGHGRPATSQYDRTIKSVESARPARCRPGRNVVGRSSVSQTTRVCFVGNPSHACPVVMQRT
jgi:hypothetical protein